MTAEIYNKLTHYDFPMTVKCTNSLYENKEYTAESKADFSPYGFRYIEIVKKANRLKVFGKQLLTPTPPKG